MNINGGFLRKWRRSIVFAAVFVLPGYSKPVEVNKFSSSFNEAFSGSQLLSMRNIVGFALILVFILAFVIFYILWSKKEKEIHQKSYKVSWRPLKQGQKRNWFRLSTSTEIEWMPAGEAASKAREIKYRRDRLVDISGGGLSFTTAETLNPGDEIKFLLDTGEDKPLTINGRVIRIFEEEAGQDGPVRRAAVQFADLLGGERDRVVSYIIKLQRDAIQKRKEEDAAPASEQQKEDIDNIQAD
jgi:hypothetical protein